ncbi:hypothetical protein BOX15_Mlig008466g1, partial [Macrostomum lignano]
SSGKPLQQQQLHELGACGGGCGCEQPKDIDNVDPTEICFTCKSRLPNIQVDSSLSERLQRLRLNGLSKAVAVDLLRCSPPPGKRRRSRSGLNTALLLAVKEIYSLQDFSSVQLLAKGFFSNVYRVTLERSGRQMALKMNGETNQRSAYREHEIMSKLSHPNVLRYHAVCIHGGRLHCLFDYIEGGSLEQLLAEPGRRLSWRVRLGLALDVARAMAYVHGQGFFHRDIASKNILIRTDAGGARPYQAVVADFGLAIKMPRYATQRLLECVGSPFWMAPECMRGCGFSTKADVFSYGIVLCELLTRLPADPDFLPRLPDFGIDAAALESSLVPPDCPRPLLQLALSACSQEPAVRPSFADLAGALMRLLDKLEAGVAVETVRDVASTADADIEADELVEQRRLDASWQERRHQQRCWNPGMKHNPFVTVRWERNKSCLQAGRHGPALLLPTGPELRSPSGLNRAWSYPDLSQDLIEFLEIARRCRPCGEGTGVTDDSGVSCVSCLSSSIDTLGDCSFA